MRLTIKNYQSHENSTLEFVSPGINAITGPNGHGKSSILRALKAVPLGDSLDRRHKTKETRVDIDGIVKVNIAGKNQYEIDGNIFKALRNTVPKEVTDRLRLGPVNFRSQHQPYFLLHDSSGAVARAMNELTDLGVIDYVAQALRSEGRVLKDIADKHLRDIEKERSKVSSLDWSVVADKELQTIETLWEFSSEQTNQITKVEAALVEAKRIQDKLDQLPPSVWSELFQDRIIELKATETGSIEGPLDKIIESRVWLEHYPGDMTLDLEESKNSLFKVPEVLPLERILTRVSDLHAENKKISDPAPYLERLEAIEFLSTEDLERVVDRVVRIDDYIKFLEKAQGWKETLLQAEEKMASIEDLIGITVILAAIGEFKSKILESDSLYELAKKDFESLLKSSGVCPLCGRS